MYINLRSKFIKAYVSEKQSFLESAVINQSEFINKQSRSINR